jgi:hypothetical protein
MIDNVQFFAFLQWIGLHFAVKAEKSLSDNEWRNLIAHNIENLWLVKMNPLQLRCSGCRCPIFDEKKSERVGWKCLQCNDFLLCAKCEFFAPFFHDCSHVFFSLKKHQLANGIDFQAPGYLRSKIRFKNFWNQIILISSICFTLFSKKFIFCEFREMKQNWKWTWKCDTKEWTVRCVEKKILLESNFNALIANIIKFVQHVIHTHTH